MKKIVLIILLAIIFIGVFSYRKINLDTNKYIESNISIEENKDNLIIVDDNNIVIESQTTYNNIDINNQNSSDTFSNSKYNENHDDANDNYNTDYFLRDQENYFPESNEVRISEARAREIAEIGFQESARRIAGEGVENKEFERVELEDKLPNNYFTRQNFESDKIYKTSVRKSYVVTRENDMGCGVSIYVDATTGLIIGGSAFGD